MFLEGKLVGIFLQTAQILFQMHQGEFGMKLI